MEETSDRIIVPEDSDLTLPSTPRFDAAASRAARSVLPLKQVLASQASFHSPLPTFQATAKHFRVLLLLFVSVLVAAIAIGAAMAVYEQSQIKGKPAAGQLSSEKSTASREADDPAPELTTVESGAVPFPSRRRQRISADDDALSMIQLGLTDRIRWGKIRHGKHRHGHGHHRGHGHD